MATIWEQNIEGKLYEVRTAGASVRLYRNGVNHSQWNPNRPLAGSIWDLITLPTLHRPARTIDDVLILGFGAGAVGRQIAELVQPQRIVGVELDPIHLSIADGFFECSEHCELVSADAVEWIHEGDTNDLYDVIIEDLYGENDGVPVRCVPMDPDWCEAISRRLKPGGMLIFNMIEPDKVPHFPILRDVLLAKRFPERIMYQIDGYENRVLAFCDQVFDDRRLKENLEQIMKSHPRCRGVEARYICNVL
ncbi:MAG: spermidine synthase [Opitutales bacterium]